MPSLSIVIPTYNRADKLLRLLKNIEVELSDFSLSDRIQVLVSDNASSDETQEKVAKFKSVKFTVNYFRQGKNIGFDGNVRFLYQAAKTDYVWFFSDDDILLPGAIAIVLDGIKATAPEVLLFSFIQPLGSNTRTFKLSNQVEVFTEPKEIIRLVSQCPKISIYVCRKVELSNTQKNELEPFYENGFYWIDLCYSVIASVLKPKVCVISEPLASCDDEFNNIRFGASVLLNMYGMFYHPYVSDHLPNMAEESRVQSYYGAIQLMFAVKMGSINSDDPGLIDKDIKSIRIMLIPLLKSPRALVQLILLKLQLVYIFKVYRKIYARHENS